MIICLFGLGKSAQQHLRCLVQFSCIKQIHIYTDYPARINHFKCSTYARSQFTSIASNANYIFALIASSTSSHALDFDLVSNLGIPVIFEKPITTSYSNTIKLLRSSAAENSVSYVFFQRRMAPEVRCVQSVVASGLLGQSQLASLSISKFKQRKNIGYLSHLGIHYIDLLFFLLPVKSFNISSAIFDDQPGQEFLSVISGSLNSAVPFSISMNCKSRFNSGTSLNIQFDNAHFLISDSCVVCKGIPEVESLYNSLLGRFSSKNCISTGLGDYMNYWARLFNSDAAASLDFSSLPNAFESAAAESFISASYKRYLDG